MIEHEDFDLMNLKDENWVKHRADDIFNAFNSAIPKQKSILCTSFLEEVSRALMKSTVKNKFLIVKLLHLLIEKKPNRFITTFNSSQTLKYLARQAEEIDPYLPIDEKGRKLMRQDPSIGNNYIRYVLELLKFCGTKYSKIQSNRSNFHTFLQELYNKKIVFPRDYKFIKYEKSAEKKVQGSPSVTEEPKSKAAFKSILQRSKLQISSFYTQLDLLDDQDLEGLLKKINETHENIFKKEAKKLQQLQIPNDADQADKDLFGSLKIFFETEQETYDSNIKNNNDVQTYITGYKWNFQSIFPSEPILIQDKIQQTVKNLIKNNAPPPKQKPITVRVSEQPLEAARKKALDIYQSRMNQRTNSPSFKIVKDQIEKQSRLIHTKPLNSRSLSPMDKSRGKSSNSRVLQSRIATIFSKPPNPNIEVKVYEGKLVPQNGQLSRVINYIKRQQQGMRRFKHSQFKEKSLIYQSNQIQIGVKAHPIYQFQDKFKGTLSMEIFVGNNTTNQIRNLKIEYQADPNLLIYAYPKTIDQIIVAGTQNKHQLLINVVDVPFHFITMSVQYQIKMERVQTVVVLPNSFIKFATYMKISKPEFIENFNTSPVKFASTPFRLSKYIPPDSFSKYIPNIESITRYSDFANVGSLTDLEQYSMIMLMQTYRCFLKINIRPNLQVIIQVATFENSELSRQYIKFYIESLQVILSQVQL